MKHHRSQNPIWRYTKQLLDGAAPTSSLYLLARLQRVYWSSISRPFSFYVRSFVDKDHTLHVWIEGQHVYSSYHLCKTGYIPGSTLWSGLLPYDTPRMIHPDTQPHLDFRAFWSRMGLIHMTHIPFDMICSH